MRRPLRRNGCEPFRDSRLRSVAPSADFQVTFAGPWLNYPKPNHENTKVRKRETDSGFFFVLFVLAYSRDNYFLKHTCVCCTRTIRPKRRPMQLGQAIATIRGAVCLERRLPP